jgi:hypothetical protein
MPHGADRRIKDQIRREAMVTYEDIKKANDEIRTTDIKGKDYAEVNQRIKAFRMVYPTGFIRTNLVSNENGICVFTAVVGFYTEVEDYHILGEGTAYEKENSSFINKTSYIENCETSAVGRALGMAGFGIDTSVASAEEVQNAINNQRTEAPKNDRVQEADLRAKVLGYINKVKMSKESIDKICEIYKVKDIKDMNVQQCSHLIKTWEKKGVAV